MTTQKHSLLLSGSIDGKSVYDLPGIGPAYGSGLVAAGYSTAEEVLNQYLNLNGDVDRFTCWLNNVCGANSRWAYLCFSALRDYCEIRHKFCSQNKHPIPQREIEGQNEEIKLLREQIKKQKESYSKLVKNYDKLVSINAEQNQQKQNDVQRAQKQLMAENVLHQKLVAKYNDVVNRNEELQQMLQKNVKDMHCKMETCMRLLEQLTNIRKNHIRWKRDQRRQRYHQLMEHCILLTNQHEKLKIQYENASSELAILKVRPKQLGGINDWIENMTWSLRKQLVLTVFYFLLFNFMITLFQRKFDYLKIE